MRQRQQSTYAMERWLVDDVQACHMQRHAAPAFTEWPSLAM
jgi:hypothetical protein